MKRFLAALAGLLGFAWWRRRAQPGAPDPAEELRAKLAHARRVEEEVAEEPEPAADEAPDDVAARRRDVHERTRRRIDELRGE